MPKKIVFRVRLDRAEFEQLDDLARISKRTKAQTVRAAISIMASLFANNPPVAGLTSQGGISEIQDACR